MSFDETVKRNWQKMSIPERENFLDQLAVEMKQGPHLWGGKSTEDLAQIHNTDDLPSELRGRLITAVTESGFSVAENKRAQTIINETRGLK